MLYEKLNLSEEVLQKKCLIKGDVDKPCAICGNLTRFIDYTSEQHICSEECMKEQNLRFTYADLSLVEVIKRYIKETFVNAYKEDFCKDKTTKPPYSAEYFAQPGYVVTLGFSDNKCVLTCQPRHVSTKANSPAYTYNLNPKDFFITLKTVIESHDDPRCIRYLNTIIQEEKKANPEAAYINAYFKVQKLIRY